MAARSSSRGSPSCSAARATRAGRALTPAALPARAEPEAEEHRPRGGAGRRGEPASAPSLGGRDRLQGAPAQPAVLPRVLQALDPGSGLHLREAQRRPRAHAQLRGRRPTPGKAGRAALGELSACAPDLDAASSRELDWRLGLRPLGSPGLSGFAGRVGGMESRRAGSGC